MASAKARPNYEVKETVKSIFKDKPALNDYDKAKAIYNYITKNISYSSVSFRQSGLVPQEPATVLNTRIGDCKDVSTLFVAMCKEAGLKANLTLVNTRDNGQQSLILPSINFNHCIAKIEINGKSHYLELTSSYLPFGSLYNSALQSVILDIDNSDTEKYLKHLNPETRTANEVYRNVNIKILNKDLIVHEDNVKVSAVAALSRQAYTELSEKDMNKRMLEGLQSTLPNAELKKLSFKNLENGDNRDSLFTSIDYNLKEEIKSIGGIEIITLPWSEKTLASDISIIGDRKFPIDFTSVYNIDKYKEIISFEIPKGKTVVESIPSVKYSNDYLEYNMIARTEKDKLIFERSFAIKKNAIPSDAINDFMETYKKIIVSDSKQLALR